jgi:hypothetical protein
MDYFAINKIAWTTWQNTRDGKVVFAWDDALDNIRFTTRFGTAENVTLVNFLIALACEAGASDLLVKNIDNLEDREMATKVAAVLKNETLVPKNLQFWPREVYALVNETMRALAAEVPQKRRSFLGFRYVLKPNETRQQVLNRAELMIEAIERGDQSLGLPRAPKPLGKMNFVERWAYALKPNGVGRIALKLGFDNADKTYQGMLENMARFPVNACAFALRAYWLDHGKLPGALDELVPNYIKSVPLDAYGRRPVQYNKERGVVYSAGSERVYDDGSFAFEERAFPPGKRPFVIIKWVK